MSYIKENISLAFIEKVNRFTSSGQLLRRCFISALEHRDPKLKPIVDCLLFINSQTLFPYKLYPNRSGSGLH